MPDVSPWFSSSKFSKNNVSIGLLTAIVVVAVVSLPQLDVAVKVTV